MEIANIIKELGGGSIAVMVVGLGMAVFMLWRRVTELQDKIIEIQMTLGKENRDLLNSTNSTLAAVSSAMQVATQALERSQR